MRHPTYPPIAKLTRTKKIKRTRRTKKIRKTKTRKSVQSGLKYLRKRLKCARRPVRRSQTTVEGRHYHNRQRHNQRPPSNLLTTTTTEVKTQHPTNSRDGVTHTLIFRHLYLPMRHRNRILDTRVRRNRVLHNSRRVQCIVTHTSISRRRCQPMHPRNPPLTHPLTHPHNHPLTHLLNRHPTHPQNQETNRRLCGLRDRVLPLPPP
jgi:hypothetical protein